MRLFIKKAHSRGLGLHKVLVIGSGELGQRVVQRLNMYPEIGFTVVGYLTRNPENVGSDIEGGKVLGLYEDLHRTIKEHDVSQIFIALPLNAHDRLQGILASLEEETGRYKTCSRFVKLLGFAFGN